MAERAGTPPTATPPPTAPPLGLPPARPRPLLLCAVGAVARATAPPRPGPALHGPRPGLRVSARPSAGRRSRRCSRLPGGIHGATVGSKARLSASLLLPALTSSSPRRSASRVRLTSSPSGSEPRLQGRHRDPLTRPSQGPPVCLFGSCL